jgi:hypothetical protein
MHRRTIALALMTAAIVTAGAAAARQSPLAPDEALSRIPGQPRSWVGAVRINPAGHSEVWVWAFTPGASPDSFAFLTEFDCDTRTARRLRREKYDGPALVEAVVENDAFHVWEPFYVEHRLTGLICDHSPLGETVPNRADAARRPAQG